MRQQVLTISEIPALTSYLRRYSKGKAYNTPYNNAKRGFFFPFEECRWFHHSTHHVLWCCSWQAQIGWEVYEERQGRRGLGQTGRRGAQKGRQRRGRAWVWWRGYAPACSLPPPLFPPLPWGIMTGASLTEREVPRGREEPRPTCPG